MAEIFSQGRAFDSRIDSVLQLACRDGNVSRRAARSTQQTQCTTVGAHHSLELAQPSAKGPMGGRAKGAQEAKMSDRGVTSSEVWSSRPGDLALAYQIMDPPQSRRQSIPTTWYLASERQGTMITGASSIFQGLPSGHRILPAGWRPIEARALGPSLRAWATSASSPLPWPRSRLVGSPTVTSHSAEGSQEQVAASSPRR